MAADASSSRRGGAAGGAGEQRRAGRRGWILAGGSGRVQKGACEAGDVVALSQPRAGLGGLLAGRAGCAPPATSQRRAPPCCGPTAAAGGCYCAPKPATAAPAARLEHALASLQVAQQPQQQPLASTQAAASTEHLPGSPATGQDERARQQPWPAFPSRHASLRRCTAARGGAQHEAPPPTAGRLLPACSIGTGQQLVTESFCLPCSVLLLCFLCCL